GAKTTRRLPSPTMWPGWRMIGKEGRPERENSLPFTPPITILVIVRLHVPVFEIGNGFSDWHGPMLWITVGGKLTSGGTSIEADGVLAVTVNITIGLVGSSLLIFKVHDLGPAEVGVKRITRLRHESGLTVAGKGLLMIVKSGHAGTKDALVTWRSHGPT